MCVRTVERLARFYSAPGLLLTSFGGFFLQSNRRRFIHRFVIDFFNKTQGFGSLHISLSFFL